MGQNNNQNLTGQGFKKDDAYQTLSMINTDAIAIAPPPIAAATAFRNDGGIIHLSQPCAYLL